STTAAITHGSRRWTNERFDSVRIVLQTEVIRLKSKTGVVEISLNWPKFAHSRCLDRNSATHSICWVCGNMSSGITCFSSKTSSEHKMFKSRANVAGWQDT